MLKPCLEYASALKTWQNELVGVQMIRFWDARIFTRLFSAGHIRTMSAATSKTMVACCRSAAQPQTSARSSPSPQQSRSATAAASSLLPCFFGISTQAVLNCRQPFGFKIPKRSRMICSCQSISSNFFPAQVPLVWQRLSINITAKSAASLLQRLSFALNIVGLYFFSLRIVPPPKNRNSRISATSENLSI